MCFVCSTVYAVGAAAMLASSSVVPLGSLERGSMLPEVAESIKAPNIETPEWLLAQGRSIRQPAASSSSTPLVVTYDVQTRGNITASLSEFKTQANQTLNDARGWSQLSINFREVSSGGQFTLVLSEASQVPTFAPGACSSAYSCRVGRFVIINQDRWLGATSSWNNASGSLRDYRHMVINHEVGHWLGHGHYSCGGAGQLAPVMQQQSMDLQGCKFNPWPLKQELRAPALGR